MALAMRPGLDSYSFHRFFGETTPWESPASVRWTLRTFLDFLDGTGLRLASLQTAYLPPRARAEEEIARWRGAGEREVVLTWGHPRGFDGGRNPAALPDALDHLRWCARIGATQMRIVLGNQNNFHQPVEARKHLLAAPLRELARAARDEGVLLSVENHADFRVRDLLDLLAETGTPAPGLCLDLGNALRTGDAPAALLREIGPGRLFMVQLKDVLRVPGDEDPRGWWPAVEFGSGHADLAGCLAILRERGYDGPAVIELSNLHTGLEETTVARQAAGFVRHLMVQSGAGAL